MRRADQFAWKGSHEGGDENFLSFQLIASHVEGERKGTMTVTFVNIALLVPHWDCLAALSPRAVVSPGELALELNKALRLRQRSTNESRASV